MRRRGRRSATTRLERAAGAPVRAAAALAIEEAVVDEVAAQGGGVGEALAEDEVHLLLAVPDAGLEVLRQHVEDDESLAVRRRDGGEALAVDEGAHHVRPLALGPIEVTHQ
jgi:hypothetical protein